MNIVYFYIITVSRRKLSVLPNFNDTAVRYAVSRKIEAINELLVLRRARPSDNEVQCSRNHAALDRTQGSHMQRYTPAFRLPPAQSINILQ